MPYGPFKKCDQLVDLIYICLYFYNKFFFVGKPLGLYIFNGSSLLLVQISNQITTIKINSAFSVV